MNPGDHQAAPNPLRHAHHLNPRQQEILIHIAIDRQSRRKTAELMGLSPSTIQEEWRRICRILTQAAKDSE